MVIELNGLTGLFGRYSRPENFQHWLFCRVIVYVQTARLYCIKNVVIELIRLTGLFGQYSRRDIFKS